MLASASTRPLDCADRPDRAVRNAELAGLLRFYLGRAVRHGTMRADAADEAAWLLGNLDSGYRLRFTRTGLIFDLSGTGESLSAEGGVEYHRIGRDLIEELLEAMPTDPLWRPRSGAPTLSSLDVSLPSSRTRPSGQRAESRDAGGASGGLTGLSSEDLARGRRSSPT